MAGKNQPPDKSRIVIMVPRPVAAKKRREQEKLREQTTRRVTVPKRS